MPRSHDDMRQPKWRRYLRMVRPNPVADLDDELRDHISSVIDDLVARGMSQHAAEAEALRRFGDVSRVRADVQRLDTKQATRVARASALEAFFYDLRHAARGLRRSLTFTLVASISIALGVAANTTIFSVVNAVLLRPIPGAHAPRLVRVYANYHSPYDWDEFHWFRDNAKDFDAFVGERFAAMGFRAGASAESERIHVSYVTRGFFSGLGIHTTLGRPFDIDEKTATDAASVGVLSHAFWERRFAGDSSVIGRHVILSGQAITIIGVAEPDFRSSVMSWVPDIIVPFAIAPTLSGTSLEDFGGSLYVTARLRAGVSRDAAQSELQGLLVQLARTDSAKYDGTTVRLDHVRGVNAEARSGVEAGSAFLMAMVGMVLLIACANVANLLMGRAAARRTELGVRLAIGASRARIVRQMLTESLLLAAIGSAAGFAIAWLITRALPAGLPPEAGVDTTYFQPDLTVALFTGGLCLATTLLFGMLPALRASSPDLVGLLKGVPSRVRRGRSRGTLVVVQAALCVLLLAVASLFLRSLASSRGVDPGFRAAGVVDVDIDLGLLGPKADAERIFATVLRGASSLPGVKSASVAAVVPLSGSNMETRVTPVGMAIRGSRDAPTSYFNVVGPKYFSTLRTPIFEGREFVESDGSSAPHVAVVNQTAAQKLWPNDRALGKRFHWGAADAPIYQVVGVSADANYVMPGEAAKPTIYFPAAQAPRSELTLQLRTDADLGTVRRGVWALLHVTVPTLPPPPVVSMTDDMAITLLPVRAGAAFLGAFGLLALMLAAAGIYGVASYSVASRVREIGIRSALGATRARLVRMVLWENGRRVAIGVGIGLALTIAVAFGLSRFLYGIEAVDPLVLTAVILTMGVVAVLATLAPAARAARADPVASISAE